MRTIKIIHILAIFAVTSVTLLLLVNLTATRHAKSASLVEPGQLTASELEILLHRIGLTPESLSASGVSASNTGAVVLAAHAALVTEYSSLQSADNVHASNASAAGQLRRRIKGGQQKEGEVAQYNSTMEAKSTAAAAREEILQSVFATAIAELSGNQIATLSTLRDNRNRQHPVEFLVVDESEAQWIGLRSALANERISQKLGKETDTAAQEILNQWRSKPAVVAAKYSLDANLSQIRNEWLEAIDTAIGE